MPRASGIIALRWSKAISTASDRRPASGASSTTRFLRACRCAGTIDTGMPAASLGGRVRCTAATTRCATSAGVPASTRRPTATEREERTCASDDPVWKTCRGQGRLSAPLTDAVKAQKHAGGEWRMQTTCNRTDRPDASRRAALKGLAAVPFAIALSRAGLANASEPRALAFHHLHTGERLSVVYFAEGEYVSESLERIDWLLRDFRTGDVCTIAPDLLDTLHALQRVCGASAFEVICGYRSPQTNAMLRNTGGGGVAEHSLHLQGRAID